jgi:hypothetical protein
MICRLLPWSRCCLFALWLASVSASPQTPPATPILNEIVSGNLTGPPDEFDPDLSNCPVQDCDQWYQDLGPSVWDGDYPDWIEIHNPGDTPLPLIGYGLSDDSTLPFKWVFPDLTLQAGGFLVVFASGKDEVGGNVHTSFELSSEGEEVLLTPPSGITCDRVDFGRIPIGCSFGRRPDAPEVWAWFDQTTPGRANDAAIFMGFRDEVRALPAAGFHAGPIEVALTNSLAESVIRFTWGGEDPMPESELYSGPMRVERTAVLKARTFVDGRAASPIVTATYLIGKPFSFPVVSLTTRPEHLWDPELGIYTPGRNANESQRIANYWHDWERPVHVEFFEPDGKRGFSVDAGLRIFGWASRANPQKSFAIMLRGRYGAPELSYRLFPDQDVPVFTSFVLRAGGGDAGATGVFFRDPFASSLLKGRQVDVQAFRPAIVYLNGEYWGIQDLREKMNEDYLASHHGIDAGDVDMISRYWRRTEPVVIEGDDTAYRALEEFLLNADLIAPSTYDHLRSVFDLENFLDYSASQIYFANYDWPGNNSKVWRERGPEARWRWLMFDLDYTFSSDPALNNAAHDTLTHATQAAGSGWPNPPWTTLLTRSFLEVPAIRDRFINRLADLLNEDFLPETVLAQLERFKALFEPEIVSHIDRWAGTGNVIPSLSTWENNLGSIREFARERPGHLRQHVQNFFGLPGTATVWVNLDPPGAGRVKLNSILIDGPDWTGTYFMGVPISLDVLPAPGYRFSSWEDLPEPNFASQPRLLIPIIGTLDLTARFIPDPAAVNSIVINEINYHAPAAEDPGDWVELHNAYAVPVDISGWVLKDREEAHAFVIPHGTILEPAAFLVLCSRLEAFKRRFPAVAPVFGDLRFNFGNDSDRVRLFDSRKNLVDEVEYGDLPPWPRAPDGGKATLALVNRTLDNSLPSSWKPSSDDYGTPGSPNRVDAAASGPGAISAAVADSMLYIRFTTGAGQQYLLQTSTDLRQWDDWTHATGTGDEISVTAAVPPGARAVFYRVAVVP